MKNKLTRFTAFVVTTGLIHAPAVFALGAKPPADPNAPPPPAWVSFMPMLVMIAVFYFLLIRPQMKQKNDRQKMIDSLKKGDKIVTQGGIIATVVNMASTTLEVKLNEETKVKILRSAVSDVYTEQAAAAVETPATPVS
jgi:preprotein translocase subunit YajC